MKSVISDYFLPRAVMKLRFPAVFYFAAFLIVYTIIVLFVFQKIVSQPWLGVNFSAPADGHGLIVSSVVKNGPLSDKLVVGQRVLQIKGKNDVVQLSDQLLQSTDVFPTYELFNAYLDNQERAARVLKESELTFVLDEGGEVLVKPEKKHPVETIPLIYFAYILTGICCAGIGFLVLFNRPELFVSQLILISTIGMSVYYFSAALQYRELALPSDWLQIVSAASMAGANVAEWGSFVIFMVFPHRIFSNRVTIAMLLLIFLITLNSTMQWIELPFHAHMLQLMIMGICAFLLLAWQWCLSNQCPVERAMVKVFVLMLTFPSLFVTLLWWVPTVIEKDVWITHEIARFIFVPILLGWVLAVFRYRLYEVEKWWLIHAIWFVITAAVLLPYTLLIYFYSIETFLAFFIALVVSSLFVFSIWKYFLHRFIPELPYSSGYAFPRLVQALKIVPSNQDLHLVWRKMLEEQFLPVEIKKLEDKKKNASVYNEGNVLYVPDIVKNSSYRLTGKNQGNSLFSPKDVESIASLYTLVDAILHVAHVKKEAVLTERDRIMRDLHDSLGAKLLTLLLRSKGHANENDARDALQMLRDIVHISSASDSLNLENSLAEWRLETYERLEIVGVRLIWEVNAHKNWSHVEPGQALLLRSFLREMVSNALKHAQPDYISVKIEQTTQNLKFSITNNGCTKDPKTWEKGFGLSHLLERFERAGGTMKVFQKRVGDEEYVVDVVVILER